MKLLSLDTSTKNFSLAVVDGHKTLASQDVILEKILSDSIIPSIQKILKKAKVSISELDGFVVGLGPGSFTSLRVGLATVKGLAFSLRKPVAGVSSLDAIAMNVKGNCPQVCVLSDAKRNLVYACWYEKKDGSIKIKSNYLLTSVEDLLKKARGEVALAGDGIQLYKKEIEKMKLKPIFTDEKLWYPKADQLAVLAFKRFEEQKFDDIHKLVPIYLYPEDCQVQK